jgi:hypothetical protein
MTRSPWDRTSSNPWADMPGVGSDAKDLYSYVLQNEPLLNFHVSKSARLVAFILGFSLMITIYSTFGINVILGPSVFLSMLTGISLPFLLATKLWNWRHPYHDEISVLNDTKSLASYFAFGATIVTISIILKHHLYQMLLVKPGVPLGPYQMLLIGPLVALASTITIGPFFYWVLGLDSRTKHRRFSTELPRCDSCHIDPLIRDHVREP